MKDQLSKLRFFSYATVAANKELSSDMIEAIAHEHTPYYDDELTDHISEKKAQGKDKDDNHFDVTIKTTASIKAKWLSLTSTNRLTPPDVRRGEEVILWQFGDTDQYWWTTLSQDHKLRRLETVIYGYSNNSKENIENAHDSMYWLEISTHRKVVRFHTSKNDGEPFTYDIQLDTKKGNFTLEDDDGNYIFLDSKEKQIKLRNKDNSYIFINKKNIDIHCLEKITVKCKDYQLTADSSIKTHTKSETKTSTDFTVKDSNYSHSSSSYSIKVPTASFSSNISAGANINATAYYGSVDYAPHP